ncbi:hypothetical protein Tco_1279980 [Tanacetum coccineum]
MTYMRSLLLDGGKGQKIPLGRPYHTQPNGVLKMMTTRKRRSSHPVTPHSPSPFAGPSRKRCRSLTTYVPSTIPALGALSPTRVDLLPPCKRFTSFLAALSPEASIEGSIEIGSEEEDINSDIMADIAAEAAATAGFRIETNIRFEGDDKAEEEDESSTRDSVEIEIDRIVGIEEEQRAQKGRVVTKEA